MNCTRTINSCQHIVSTHSNINKSLKLESNLSNITLYHGSPNTELTQLDIAKSYGSGDQYGRGLYLTTDYDEADGYAKGGRVYKVQLDDSLKFFNMEDKLPKGIVDFLYNELKDSDDDFKNSILRYARKIYKNDDMDSLEKFYDEKEEEWKSKDGYYSANKPEVDRDDKGDLIVIYTDYNDLKNSLEQLTGNMTLRAFGGDLNPQLFGNWIMSEGYDGIITHSGKWYILYKHPEKAKIVENLQKIEESNFRAFKFINHKKTQVDEGNNRQELEDKYEGSEIFVDENDDISKMCESNQYPLDVKDIKNLNQWFRDNIDKEPDEDWRNRLKDAYDCSYTQIFKGSPLKRKREIVQQYLNYKNKIEESKKSDDLYYTIYNHAKKLIELNPNIEPDKLNMSNTYLTDDLETTRTYNEVLKKIDSLTKYLDTDIKLGVISEEKAQYKRDIAGIMKRYVDMRINTIKGIKTESTHKLEEASRNELLALAKSETITRYNKSAGYKGFYLVDIDTTAIKTRDALIITNKVGKYYDTIELEDILYWIGLEVDNSRDKKATVENVRKALRGAMDGMDIKVDCSCSDFRFRFSYQATVLGYKYGKPETREAKITNPHNYGSMCKHLIAMLSNKQWIEQVASTVTDWVIENVEWVREFLQVTEDEFKVPDEYARYIGKHGAMKKAWNKIPDKDTEKEEQEQDQEMDQEEQPEEDIQDEIPEENNAENQESDEELEEK